jgi:hypothetical protein
MKASVSALPVADSGTARHARAFCDHVEYVDLTITGDSPRNVALYVVDKGGNVKSMKVEALDTDNEVALDTREVADFKDGKWLKYKVKGHIKFRLYSSEIPSAPFVQGVFFGWK